jgi:hypothetical protein
MPYRVIRGTPQDVEDQLSGTYVLGAFHLEGLPVGGKTLIFVQPQGVTVTFSGSLGDMRTLVEIRNQINEAFTGSPASLRPADPSNQGSTAQKFLALQHDTNGIEITGGTARADFNIPSAEVKLVPVAAAKVAGFMPAPLSGHLLVLVAP